MIEAVLEGLVGIMLMFALIASVLATAGAIITVAYLGWEFLQEWRKRR